MRSAKRFQVLATPATPYLKKGGVKYSEDSETKTIKMFFQKNRLMMFLNEKKNNSHVNKLSSEQRVLITTTSCGVNKQGSENLFGIASAIYFRMIKQSSLLQIQYLFNKFSELSNKFSEQSLFDKVLPSLNYEIYYKS